MVVIPDPSSDWHQWVRAPRIGMGWQKRRAGTKRAATSKPLSLDGLNSLFQARLQVFLDECQLRESAWDWAKEVSRTNRPRPSVVALFDEDLACVHVGAHHDAALAVGHMVRKHGIKTVAALKEETFPPDVAEEPVGLQMMASLVQSWLAETSQRGNTPVGNVAEGWADFDPSQSPFVIGAFGEAGEDPDAPKPESEMTEEELVDMRRQNLYEAMNEAMKVSGLQRAGGQGDEQGAAG